MFTVNNGGYNCISESFFFRDLMSIVFVFIFQNAFHRAHTGSRRLPLLSFVVLFAYNLNVCYIFYV